MNAVVRERRSDGFTLIELIFVVALVSIMLTIAAPSFTAFISSNRATSAVNDFLQGITATRNEALKRGKRVYLVPLDSALPTSVPLFTGSWRFGWAVCDKLDAGPTGCDPNNVISRHQALESSTSVANPLGSTQPFTDGAAQTYISFDGTGYPRTLSAGGAMSGGIWINDGMVAGKINQRTLCLAILGTTRIVQGNVLCQ